MYFHSFLLNNFHYFPQDTKHSISLWKIRAHSSLCLYFSFPWLLPSCLFGEIIEETWLPVWPRSRTQVVGDSSSPNLCLACVSPLQSLFPKAVPRTQLGMLTGWWANMDSTGDWTPWGLLDKLLRFWSAGAEIHLSCACPRQVSQVSSLAY